MPDKSKRGPLATITAPRAHWPGLSYLGWHSRSAESRRKGHHQYRCRCGLWRWTWEGCGDDPPQKPWEGGEERTCLTT